MKYLSLKQVSIKRSLQELYNGTIPLSFSDSKRPCDRFKITYPWNSKHGTKPVELLPVGMAHELICLWIENGHRNSMLMVFNNKYFIWNNCNCILITVGLQILLLNWVQTKINDGSNHWSASPPSWSIWLAKCKQSHDLIVGNFTVCIQRWRSHFIPL